MSNTPAMCPLHVFVLYQRAVALPLLHLPADVALIHCGLSGLVSAASSPPRCTVSGLAVDQSGLHLSQYRREGKGRDL